MFLENVHLLMPAHDTLHIKYPLMIFHREGGEYTNVMQIIIKATVVQ